MPNIKAAGIKASKGMNAADERRNIAQHRRKRLHRSKGKKSRPNMVINQAFAGFTNIEKKLTSNSPADIVINVREVMPKNRLLFLVFLDILR